MSPLHRLCAGDIGSNSIKVRVVEFRGPLRKTLFESRYPIRLGASSFGGGAVTADDISATVAAFEEASAMARSLGVERSRVVATSALREASNSAQLVEAVRAATGWDIDIISGAEEAHLVARGLHTEMQRDAHNLVIDIGGGSTELITTRVNLEVDGLQSLRLGAVRLAQMIKMSDPPTKRQVGVLEAAVESAMDAGHLPAVPRGSHVIGLAGVVRSILEVKLARGGEANQLVSFKELERMIRAGQEMTHEQMQSTFGIDLRRAQIFLPGAMILRGIMRYYGIARVTVSMGGLRDGLLLEMLDDLTGGLVHSEDVLVRRIGEKYGFDTAHAEHVTYLASEIFDQLVDLHGLKEEHRKVLRIAAMLHDIGRFISYSSHHKHGHYLVMNEEIPGLLPPDQKLVAALVRYHRKALPSETHPEFAGLSKEARLVLEPLAAMLRLADALDRQHRRLVTGVQLTTKGEKVEMVVSARLPADLELAAVGQKADMFQKVFGRALIVRGEWEQTISAVEEEK